MVKKGYIITFIFLLLTFSVANADYLFNVKKQEVHVWIKSDCSADIWYYIHFANNIGGKTIDIVDIGLPFDNYRLETAEATINGSHAMRTAPSEYIPIGVEVHLGLKSIPPGKEGVVGLRINQPGMVFEDEIDENYASTEILTNFFADQFTTGNSRLDVYFHFPKGVKPEEPRYHKDKFTYAGIDDNGQVYYFWLIEPADATLAYRFGASFPKKYVDSNAIRSETVFSRIGLFFANIFRNIWPQPLCVPCIFPWGLIIFIVVISIIHGRSRRLKYFKPAIAAKGVGIKRGLTAVEAAVLLEKPLNKVLSMIVFGLLKKGYINVLEKSPFKVENTAPTDASLYNYEVKFLSAIQADRTLKNKSLKTCMVDLIEDVQKKVKGFNLQETRQYYESIVDTAWKHVENAELENSLEWVMVDKDFDDKFEKSLPQDRTIVSPSWWPMYYHGYGRHYYGAGYPSTTGSGKASLSPKQFINSVVTGIEGVSHNVVTSVESFTSSITDVTNPIPKTSSGWSSGRGGGGCACACACAGCACACAGGGR